MLRIAVTAARPNNPTRSPRGAPIRRHNICNPPSFARGTQRGAPTSPVVACSCRPREGPNKADFGVRTRPNWYQKKAPSAAGPPLSPYSSAALPQQHTLLTLGEALCQKVKREPLDYEHAAPQNNP